MAKQMPFPVTIHIRTELSIICYVIYVPCQKNPKFFISFTKLSHKVQNSHLTKRPIVHVSIFRKKNKHPPMV